jgi:hypothetical protein
MSAATWVIDLHEAALMLSAKHSDGVRSLRTPRARDH